MEIQYHHLKFASSDLYLLEFDADFCPEDYFDKLTPVEKARFGTFHNLKRQQEFVATRLLKHEIFGYDEILYEEHGAPYLEQEGYISISHAQNMVGIANNKNFRIGFDVEAINPKVLRVFSKFLNAQELQLFDTTSAEELIKTWSFKECLYKLAGRKLIDFKKDLLLLTKDEMYCEAQICNPGENLFTGLEALKFKNYVITVNSKEVSYVQK